MYINKYKIGDKVEINDPKSNKHGIKGTVKSLFTNGVIVMYPKTELSYTPVKFNHLKKDVHK